MHGRRPNLIIWDTRVSSEELHRAFHTASFRMASLSSLFLSSDDMRSAVTHKTKGRLSIWRQATCFTQDHSSSYVQIIIVISFYLRQQVYINLYNKYSDHIQCNAMHIHIVPFVVVRTVPHTHTFIDDPATFLFSAYFFQNPQTVCLLCCSTYISYLFYTKHPHRLYLHRQISTW